MSDKQINLIRTFGVVVGVVITLLTCGLGLGLIKSDVAHLGISVSKISAIESDLSDVKQKMAFFEGIVVTKLDNQSDAINRIELALNELTRDE